jgi:hypothetical protein
MAPWADILRQQFPERLLSDPKVRRRGLITKGFLVFAFLCFIIAAFFFSTSLKKDWFAQIKVSVILENEPNIDNLPSELRNRIRYIEDTQTLEIDGPMPENESEIIGGITENPSDKKKLEQHLEEISSESSGFKEASTLMTLVRLLLFLLCLVFIALLGCSIWFYSLLLRQIALLKGLAALDPSNTKQIHDFLKPILHPRARIGKQELRPEKKTLLQWLRPNRRTMLWLKTILDNEIQESRERILRQRLSTKPAIHL